LPIGPEIRPFSSTTVAPEQDLFLKNAHTAPLLQRGNAQRNSDCPQGLEERTADRDCVIQLPDRLFSVHKAASSPSPPLALLRGRPALEQKAAGGWRCTETLIRCYQQPDKRTMLDVVLAGAELRERKT
jgi:hypothetical protein